MGQKFNFILGCVAAAVIAEAALPVIPDTKAYKYSKAITKCESELPRNQKCEIYARPVEAK